MRKTLQTIALAALCLNFTIKAIAQTPQNKAIDITTKGIQIGQKIPDLPNLANYKGKLILLDFWATWCSPCVAMIPKMEALQDRFKDQIQIIPVTYQSQQETTTFLNKLTKDKPSTLPQITGDKELHQLFPHIYLPHYVWIDKQSKVVAITGMDEINAGNIQKMLEPNTNLKSVSDTLKQKHDLKIDYDKTKPFLINGNGGDGRNLIYHSLLTGYGEGLTSTISVTTTPNKGRHVMFSNVSIKNLMQRAYSTFENWYSNNRIILELKDSSGIRSGMRGPAVTDWLRSNGYCYELILPPHLANKAGIIMQQEFDKLIPQYKASICKRKIKCLALIRTSNTDKIAHKGLEAPAIINNFGCELKGTNLNFLLLTLNTSLYQNSKIPLVDLTGYTSKVDLSIKANLKDMAAFNKALEVYDLKFEERETELNMLLISDRN